MELHDEPPVERGGLALGRATMLRDIDTLVLAPFGPVVDPRLHRPL
jgi:hypothetical protein